MGYFAPNTFTTFVQCGRGTASEDSPFTYTNDSNVYETINSITIPVGTGANESIFYTSTGRWHIGNGQPFQMYITAGSVTGQRSTNTVTVSNAVPDNGAGKPNFAYLQNQTFMFSGLTVAPHTTIAFYLPFIDNLSQGYIYCTNNNGITGSITPQSHTVSYNANGGSGAPGSQKKLWGSNLTLSYSVPFRTGYVFLYWNTSSDGKGTTYSPGDLYTEDKDITLYAIWRQKTQYTVTFQANGGTSAPLSQTKYEGDTLILTSQLPSKTFKVTYDPNGGSISPTSKIVSCIFSEWNTKSDGSGVSYNPGSSYTSDQSITLYAIWQNPSIGSLPTPNRTDCQFDTWTLTLNGSDKVDSDYIVPHDLTIYAKWKYAVTFDANGGTIAITDGISVTQHDIVTIYKTHGESLVIPSNYSAYVVKTTTGTGTSEDPGGGYTPSSTVQFSGWSADATSEAIQYEPGDIYELNSPIILYAIYNINRYTVVFTDGYSGTILKQYDNVPQGTGVTPPPDPTREGFIFSGWLGNYSCIMSNTTIEAFWGFTPIWIRIKNTWVKYEPTED